MIYALIVIYNKKITDSITFMTIKNQLKKLNLIIYDNSTNEELYRYNKNYCKKENIKYYGFLKNNGLSKAYNSIINSLNKTTDNYIMILDDDTTLNDNYFVEVYNEINIGNKQIVLPRVIAQDKNISPSIINKFGKIKNYSDNNKNIVTGINSGMVVNLSIYNKIKYNENLFLDYIDHNFMIDVNKEKYKIHILNSSINQNYSRNEKQDFINTKTRFLIFKKDYWIFCKINNYLIIYFLTIIKLKIKYLLQYGKII